MKSQSTTTLGLIQLRHNGFSQAGTASFAPLAATFTPVNFQVIQLAGGGCPSFIYRFSITSGKLPAWVIVGAVVVISASVTISGVSQNLTEVYAVRSVDASGMYFDVNGVRPHNGLDATAFTQAVAQTALDSGSGLVTTPLVSLSLHAQKVMFQATGGTLTLAPVVDASGNAPYAITLLAGSEYEKVSQPGSKIDLADWQVKGNGATLSVCFQ